MGVATDLMDPQPRRLAILPAEPLLGLGPSCLSRGTETSMSSACAASIPRPLPTFRPQHHPGVKTMGTAAWHTVAA